MKCPICGTEYEGNFCPRGCNSPAYLALNQNQGGGLVAESKYKIVIVRKNSALGCLASYAVYLDNTFVGDLKNGQTLTIPVSEGQHILSFAVRKKTEKVQPIYIAPENYTTTISAKIDFKTSKIALKGSFPETVNHHTARATFPVKGGVSSASGAQIVERHAREAIFQTSKIIAHAKGENLLIDYDNKLFCKGDGKKVSQPICRFDEVINHETRIVDQKAVTKKRGGVGHAVVGGAMFGTTGAVVGASLAKSETKLVGGKSIMEVHYNGAIGTGAILIHSPMPATAAFFDACVAENKSKGAINEGSASSADEIRKYKELLDEGIITREEFEAKKKALLNV